jgi:nicotinate phosphoribosyltransferase
VLPEPKSREAILKAIFPETPSMSETEFGFVTPSNLTAFTDLYELTMLQGYYREDHNPEATFSLFFRELPTNRGYVIAAGLEQALHYVEELSFEDETLKYLAGEGFDDDFLEYLGGLEFTGEVRAIPEGTPVFPDEPLLEVTAPLMEAQLLETALLNQIGFQSLVATKAARMRDVVRRYGDDQNLVDFGCRRAHGTDAGMKASRGSYVGGFDGTSNVAAGEAFGVPTFGTMAHSWIQSFDTERESFEAFVEEYGEDSVLLVDTYDTVTGTELAMDVAREKDVDISGVRIDSGDLAALSREVDGIIDDDTGLIVSSGMDEYAIEEFFEDGGVATGFGPGTALTTTRDAPAIDVVYKLTAIERDGEVEPSMKLSTGKVTYPNPKQVSRVASNGTYVRDVIGLRDDDLPGERLLETVVEDGDLVYDLPDIDAIRERTLTELEKLPRSVREIEDPSEYAVEISDHLGDLTAETEAELEREQEGR